MADWKIVAEDNYAAASELVTNRRWRSAVSRAYYAVFALLAGALLHKGVLMPKDREGPSHAKLAALVSMHLTELGEVRWRVFHRVKGLYALRLDADYRTSLPTDNGHARKAVALMSDVFHMLKVDEQ